MIAKSTVKSKEKVASEAKVEDAPVTACQHHWLIEPPKGPTSQGVCRLCGEERAFQNYYAPSNQGDWRS